MVINRRVIPSRSVPEEQVMAVSFELSSVLDKAYEDKSLTEILAAPPSALAGLTERHDQILSDVFGIQTVAELGRNKHSLWPERWSRSPARSNTADGCSLLRRQSIPRAAMINNTGCSRNAAVSA
jgi:hypothetical protein